MLLLTRDMYLEGKKAVSWPGLQELLFPSETDMHLVRHQRYKRPDMKQQSVWYLATNYHCLYSSGVKPQGIRETILTQKTPYPFTLHPHPQWTWKELGTQRKKPFQINVTYDSAPGNNVWIGFGLIPSFPTLPAKRSSSNDDGDGNEDRKKQYATCTSPPYLPPKILYKHCFQFLLGRL